MFQDLSYLAIWWSTFFVFGLTSLPIVFILFKNFTDGGYGFAKTIGSLVITYLAFLGATLHLVPLTRINLFLFLLVFLGLNIAIFLKNKKRILNLITKNSKVLVLQEILFTIGLMFWSTIRGFQPDIRGLEKFMDFGFINSILKSKFLPPPDMWFAGKPINYYWFGHFWTAVITKISGIPSHITYNLMIATILGLMLMSTVSIVSTLFKNISRKISVKKALLVGLISAILLSFGGNFHTPIYALKNGVQKYWYPDATRFIGYNPETEDKTIHEFPFYSFVVSDLHAHFLDLPFVLLYLALFWALIKKGYKEKGLYGKEHLFLGFVLGIMFMTNIWNFGNYLLVSGFVLFVFNLRKHGLGLESIWKTTISLLIIILVGIITILPFILNFTSIAQGLQFVHSRTPLWQLAILWGMPAILTIVFFYFLKKSAKKLKTPDFFVFSLLLAGWTLIILPEIFYVKDIYAGSHYRANTMFKLTYQAFVLFYLSAGYITARTLTAIKKSVNRNFLLLFYTFIFLLVLIYPYFSIRSYYGELKDYRGLSGRTWVMTQHPSLYQAILWLEKNTDSQPTILEAPGDSYTDYNLISAYTGLPTIQGWFVHEWLWRGSAQIPQERVGEIEVVYTSNNLEETKKILIKYKVKYVVLGKFEREKYPKLKEKKFDSLGTLVFSDGNTKIYQILN